MNKEERMYELLKHRYDKEIKIVNLFEDIEALLQENEQLKDLIDKIKKEVDKIFVEGQIINKCLLLSIYENIWRILK